jgi:hypothetical protein
MQDIDKALEVISKMRAKYWDLVWYAGSDPDAYPESPDNIRAGCFLNQVAVETAYEKDVAELLDPGTGRWTRGFNCGMLASLNLVLTMLEEVKYPIENEDEDDEGEGEGKGEDNEAYECLTPEERIELALEEFPLLET